MKQISDDVSLKSFSEPALLAVRGRVCRSLGAEQENDPSIYIVFFTPLMGKAIFWIVYLASFLFIWARLFVISFVLIKFHVETFKYRNSEPFLSQILKETIQ